MKIMGVKFDPLLAGLQRRLQELAIITLIFLLLLIAPIATFTLAYLLFFTNYYWISLVYIAFWYSDRNTPSRGSRPIQWVRNWSLWDYCRDYFPLKLIKTADLDPGKNYILCLVPHGIFPVGCMISFATEALGVSKLFPGLQFRGVTLDNPFRMAIGRDIYIALGTCSVSKESVRYLLNPSSKGMATILLPGGSAEAIFSVPGTYRIILKNRKGFVKLALENGASLVPVVSFRANDITNQIWIRKGSILYWIQDSIQKTTGYPVILVTNLFFPNRLPVTTVVGSPITVDQVKEPTTEQVDELHQKFMDALVDFFEEEKHKYVPNPDETFLTIE